MSGLAIGLGARLIGLRSALSKISPRTWLIIGCVVAAFAGFLWHQHAARKAIRAAHDAGYAQAAADIEKRAKALKAKADALSAKISAEERKRNDEANRRIAAAADDLRLRGPGKAVCPRSAGLPSAAGGRVAASGQSPAAVDQVLDGAGIDLIGLPFAGAVAGAEQSDLNRQEVLSWRDWYAKQKANWPK